jgi:Na+/H+ antiporter NhaD/arsenite permease-like protein
MVDAAISHLIVLLIFFIGYLAIIFEHQINVNKTASALLMATLTWLFLFLTKSDPLISYLPALNQHLGDVCQVIFFLLAAMMIIELIDSHHGFQVITEWIRVRSKKKLLWVIGIIAFFLSAVIDNLTTTVLMITLLRKLISDTDERLLFGSMVVLAANTGGVWSPIGDVTTTMLWIKGCITPIATIQALLLPSLFSLFFILCLFGRNLKGSYSLQDLERKPIEPGGRLIFLLSLIGFLFVPFFHTTTALPPFMGMIVLLSILWIITDLLHRNYEHRQYLLPHHVLTRIDVSGILFFFGILLCIGSLDAFGILKSFACWLNEFAHHRINIIAFLIGLLSAIVDNVPLTAATIGMYDRAAFPPDSALWQLLAYATGTGGSILLIGSAAGVAFMSLEKVRFFWYLKYVSWIAFLSYLLGFVVYLLF